MKKALLPLMICIVATTMTFTNSSAQSKLIHYWNFNALTGTMYTPTINAIPADYTDLPGANARILYSEQPGTSVAYSSFIESFTSSASDYDTVNERMGASAGTYIRTRNPSDSMELLFFTPSTHFKNLVFTFGTSRPTNGMKYQDYDYSVDSGATWITTGLSMVTDSVWSTFQRITLTSTNTAINNNSRLVFRIKWTGNNTGTNGNNRFDNVSLDGDSIINTTGLGEAAVESTNYILYPNPVNNILDVIAPAEGMKNVVITDIIGRIVYEGSEEKSQFSINTAALQNGCYFIRIGEVSSGTVSTIKFIRN